MPKNGTRLDERRPRPGGAPLLQENATLYPSVTSHHPSATTHHPLPISHYAKEESRPGGNFLVATGRAECRPLVCCRRYASPSYLTPRAAARARAAFPSCDGAGVPQRSSLHQVPFLDPDEMPPEVLRREGGGRGKTATTTTRESSGRASSREASGRPRELTVWTGPIAVPTGFSRAKMALSKGGTIMLQRGERQRQP